MWKMMRESCYAFTKAYAAVGGDSAVIDLPKIGIFGNEHFMFQDYNSDVIAEHLNDWLIDRKLRK
jgi:hypothetical protein